MRLAERMSEAKECLIDVVEVLKDDRFSWKFKILCGLTNGECRVVLGSALYYLKCARRIGKFRDEIAFDESLMWYIKRAEKELDEMRKI